MGRRLGKRRRKVALAEAPLSTDRKGPVDRRATDLLRNAEVAIAVVDDPYPLERGDKITTLRSLRDDPLERLHIRAMIDDAQRDAGKEYRADLERSEIGNVRAIDPSKEAVDGGRIVEAISETQRRAVKRVSEAGAVMGMLAESIVRAVLSGNLFPAQVAVARGFTSEREKGHYAWIFRKALEQLAVFYGTSNKLSYKRMDDPTARTRR